MGNIVKISRTGFIALVVPLFGVLASLGMASAGQATRSRSGGGKPCRPANSRTLAEGRAGRIYAIDPQEPSSKVFGCLYRTGKPQRFRLPAEADGFSTLRFIDRVTLREPWAAYCWFAVKGVDVLRSGVVVENLRTGRLAHVDPAITEIPGRVYGPGSVLAMDLKGNGSVAWIAEDPGHNPPYSQVDSDGVKGPMVLDEGPEIDPNSLSLEDSALSWINAGSPRSATLR